MHRRNALLLSSVVALTCPAVGWAGNGPVQPAHPRISLSALPSMRFSYDSVDTEPINGFIPQVVFGLTNEQDDDSANEGYLGLGIQSSAPGGSSLPTNPALAAPFYSIATLDSGSANVIISYDASQGFDFPDAGLVDGGNNTVTVAGASGMEDLTVTNAMGVYASDFSHANVNNLGLLNVSSGSLQGQYNIPALVGNQGDGLPNIIGSNILAQYRLTIQNSQPQHLTVGGVVYQTPKVTLGAFSSTVPAGYYKLTLKTVDATLGGAETSDAPLYTNFGAGTGPTDPDGPGAWAYLYSNGGGNGGVSISRNGTSVTNQSFLFDTGSQVSVISDDEAASVGIFNVSPANADFTEQVQGVGGITEVPGYFLDTLTILTLGGKLTFNRVPVLVLDVPDPADPSQNLAGILGTQLFSDRDLILNTNVDTNGQTYVAIGPQMQWNYSTGGNWSNASNWAVVLPNGVDMQANFYGAITAPAIINVDIPVTVGRITFNNTNRYTLSGTNAITLDDSADASQINVQTGSHTIATPVILASDTTVTVIPTASTLTMSGVVSSSGPFGIIESGFGTLLLSNTNTYTGQTNVTSGTITVTGSISGSTNVSTAIGAILNAAGPVNAGLSKLTVLNSDGIVNIGPNANTSGPAAVTLASIEVGSDPTSIVKVLSSPLHANRTVLITSGISFDSSSAGQIDLKDNDMIIHGSTLGAVQQLLQSGYNSAGGNSGYWNGPGIVSSSAAADSTFLTTLGMIQNGNGSSAAIFSTFDGQSVISSDILVKFTYYGDTNLDGKVDGTDYSRIDNGYLTHQTGWYNGDFNYDGIVNGSDYTLMDNAFNRQGAHLSDEFAAVASEVGGSSVPEPTAFGLVAYASLALLGRRRKM